MWLKLKIMKVLKVCDCFTQHLTNISLDAAQSGETSGGAAETKQYQFGHPVSRGVNEISRNETATK